MRKFLNTGKSIVLLEVYLPNAKKKVVLSHGFLSNKNNFFMRLVSFSLMLKGIGSVRFNYGCEDINDRIDVLKDVINYLGKTTESIGLLGSSLGGMTSIICASNPLVKSLVLVNSVYDQRETYENYLKNHRILSLLLTHNAKKHFFKYDLKKIVKCLNKPVLIISGTKDPIVSSNNMKELYDDVNAEKKLIVFKNEGHVIRRPQNLIKSVKAITSWFKKTL